MTERDAGGGEPGRRADALFAEVYDTLRKIADARLSRLAPGQTLQATALVHDAFVRLSGRREDGFGDTRSFYGAAAVAMRDIMVERCRRRDAGKRGGGLRRESASRIGELAADGAPLDDVISLDEALRELAAEYPRKAELVMLRYFAGLEVSEAAAALGVSLRTAERDWRFARAWLRDRLGDHAPS